VVEAAKARIRWLVRRFDDVIVSFSGGKDSLVCLELVDQVYKELGIHKKVKFKFMDEELVCDSIIDFLQKQYECGRFEGQYYALQMYVGFFVMGRHEKFLSWDTKRKWHRQPPPYAIMTMGHDTSIHNENTISKLMHPDTSRKICEIVGVRAQESMKRKQAISRGGLTIGGQPNYLSCEGMDHIWSAKPIFDWSELDVFKFFRDYNIEYCNCYDAQAWTKAPLRVASALHERAAGQFFKMKEIEPLFYEQLRSLYPEIETHFRYWKEVDPYTTMYRYPRTFEGIRQYIREQLDESHRDTALKFVNIAEGRRTKRMKLDPTSVLGDMPVLQVFREVIGGKFVKGAAFRCNVSQADVDYEEGRGGPNLPLQSIAEPTVDFGGA
jgi:3'-phosphoadenosine 5'-phosphosulfate sulfotransferase (PAPS reductase)/FAD synthetase